MERIKKFSLDVFWVSFNCLSLFTMTWFVSGYSADAWQSVTQRFLPVSRGLYSLTASGSFNACPFFFKKVKRGWRNERKGSMEKAQPTVSALPTTLFFRFNTHRIVLREFCSLCHCVVSFLKSLKTARSRMKFFV